jgi:hypothetical protein
MGVSCSTRMTTASRLCLAGTPEHRFPTLNSTVAVNSRRSQYFLSITARQVPIQNQLRVQVWKNVGSDPRVTFERVRQQEEVLWKPSTCAASIALQRRASPPPDPSPLPSIVCPCMIVSTVAFQGHHVIHNVSLAAHFTSDDRVCAPTERLRVAPPYVLVDAARVVAKGINMKARKR